MNYLSEKLKSLPSMQQEAPGGNGGITRLILNLITRSGSMFNAGRFIPGKQPRYSLQRRLCGFQGRPKCKWRSKNLLPSKI